ncbi:hypothetical protein FEP58_05633 [Burkholderia multivorans]|nr:hypothetical protein [Burkholderia multivorans]
MAAQRVEPGREARRQRLPVREQPAFVVELQHLEPDRGADRMRGVRVTVADDGRIGAAARNAFVDFIGHQHGAHRRIAGGQSLRDRHQVGLHVFDLAGEQRARAAETRDHLVGDEQDAEAAARVAHRLQPAGGRHDHAARALHGFAEERGDIVRAELGDFRFERRDRCGDQRGRIVAERVAVRVRRRNVVLVGARQIEVTMERGQRGEAGADRRRAVIAALERDHLLLRRPARRIEVVRDEADRRVDGVGAAEREVHAVQRGGRERREPLGEFDRGLRTEMEVAGRVRQLRHLLGGRLDDAVAAVADVHAPQARERVEQRTAVGIAQEHAVGGFEHGHAARFVRAIVDDGMDQMVTIGFDQGGVGHGRAGLSSWVSDGVMLANAHAVRIFNLRSETYVHGFCTGPFGIFCCAVGCGARVQISSRAHDRRHRSSAGRHDGAQGSRAPHRRPCRGASRSRCAA